MRKPDLVFRVRHADDGLSDPAIDGMPFRVFFNRFHASYDFPPGLGAAVHKNNPFEASFHEFPDHSRDKEGPGAGKRETKFYEH